MAIERRLVVMTLWGWLGPFGLALVLTGFRAPSMESGLGGFGLLLVAAGAHLLVNTIYGANFSAGETALGLTCYAAGAIAFALALALVPDFGLVRLWIGVIGFGALALALVVYLIARYGVSGSISLLDEARLRPYRSHQ